MRIVDICTAIIGLVILSPLLLLIAILVKYGTPGGALFKQTRIGQNSKTFTCLKFRTMYEGTGDRPTHDVGQSSITRIGSFLRRFKLDEIPQLINVLLGEMSLVGPRPCLPSQTELIALRRKSGALNVLPGITGLAQIRGVDMSKPDELAEIDGAYAKSRSLLSDILIIFKTFAHVIMPNKSKT